MDVFDGAIAGFGTSSGTRVVVGIWAHSPFGAVTDAMVESPDGRRTLIAPTARVADYIAATYSFDEVRVEPTSAEVSRRVWTVRAGPLRAVLTAGARTPVGALLVVVPRRLARSRRWCRAVDPVAARIRPGVHTVGTAGNGRREYYCGLDEHAVTAVEAHWDGHELGPLRAVDPPVRFGFGSAPRRPALVRVTTLIEYVG